MVAIPASSPQEPQGIQASMEPQGLESKCFNEQGGRFVAIYALVSKSLLLYSVGQSNHKPV